VLEFAVKEPVSVADAIEGDVRVLFVRFCVPVSVATVESIAIVTAPEPSNDDPESPVPIVRGFVVDAFMLIAAEPSKVTPFMLLATASFVAVSALPVTLPVSAPTNPVDVTDVRPARVVAVAPSAIFVEPTVKLGLVNPEFGIVDTELITPEPEVVTYPDVVNGSVTVPVNVGDDVVAIPVTAPVEPFTLSTPVLAIVTAPEPLYEVPERPVPIVSAFRLDPSDTPEIVEFVSPAFGIVATLEITPAEVVVTYPEVVSGSVTVPVNVGEAFVASPDIDPPSETAVPFMLIEEFVRLELAILEIVFDKPEIVLFVSVSLVARPTRVSVDVGNVSVPALLI